MIIPFQFSKYLRRLRRFPFMWWACVLGVALATGWAVATTVARADAAASRYDNPMTVYATLRPLGAGDVVESADVAVQERPEVFVPAGAVTSDPVGRVMTNTVTSNEVLTAGDLGAAGVGGPAALLKDGEQGIAIVTDEKGLTLTIGDYVSILASDDGSVPVTAEAIADTIATGRVIHATNNTVTVAVDQDLTPAVAAAITSRAITLAITSP